jgi:ABC-type antimicrobial peptide transport system permease subunit
MSGQRDGFRELADTFDAMLDQLQATFDEQRRFAAMGLVNDWPFALPPAVIGIAVGVTLIIGAIAGLHPAIRAARTPPTAALSS